MAPKKRLGEILLQAELINRARLDAALRLQAVRRQRLGSTLLETGFVREDDLLRCLSLQLRVPSVNLREIPLMRQVLRALPVRAAERHHVFPVAVRREGGRRYLILAMADPTDLRAISEIEFEVGMNVRPAVSMESSIMRAIARYYRFRHTEAKPDLAAAAPAEPAPASGNGSGGGNGRAAAPESPAAGDAAGDLAPDSRQLAREFLSILVRRGLLDPADLRLALRRAG